MTAYLYGEIATAITIIAYLPYIISILHHKTKPNRTTWLVLFLIGVITFIVYRSVGATTTLGVSLANVAGPFVVFILSCRYGEGWNTLSDFKYLLISIFAIILWQIFDSPLLGLIFNLSADFIAFLPTIQKSIVEPWTEDLLTWWLFTLGGILNILAIQQWTLSIALYPLYILLAEGLVAIILARAYFLKKIK
jgi:hypothetical protein